METITFRKQLNGLTRVDMEEYFDDVELGSLYQWIDRIPLSRQKKNIGKDFADAVLMAEIIKHYIPKMVELHNYTPASNTKQKMENWYLLNRRCLRKLDLDLSDEVIRALANEKPKVVEKVLMLLRLQVDKYLQRQGRTRAEIEEGFMEVATIKDKPSSTPPPKDSPQKSSRESDQKAREKALVPVKTGRSSPGKSLVSPRKYGKGEIPHNHPDRSYGIQGSEVSYNFDGSKSYFDPAVYIYPASDNVPRSYLEEKEMECMAKDETIRILNSKIRRLEHLLQLKDSRLYDLQGQLAREQGLYYILNSKIRRLEHLVQLKETRISDLQHQLVREQAISRPYTEQRIPVGTLRRTKKPLWTS